MRAYELIKETFSRSGVIGLIHLVWLFVCLLFFWLFHPDDRDLPSFLLIWSGIFLPLALSAGIFGSDIASGRIGVLVTKPFWPGELYIYRFLGLSLQSALHLILCGLLITLLHTFTGVGSIDRMGIWLFSCWLLSNTCAALSTSLSVVVKRAYNSLLVIIAFALILYLWGLLKSLHRDSAGTRLYQIIVTYTCPPVEQMTKLATGRYTEYSLIAGQYGSMKAWACVIHHAVLVLIYGCLGIVLLNKRSFQGKPN